jgi:NDP-sugar pyrophosphorylase family protein
LVLNNVTNIVIATPLEWKAQLKKQVDKLKKDSEFTGRYGRIRVTYFTLQDASNLGNTLREVNDLESLEEQFLVMYSDIVCNANIEPAIKMHWDAIEE